MEDFALHIIIPYCTWLQPNSIKKIIKSESSNQQSLTLQILASILYQGYALGAHTIKNDPLLLKFPSNKIAIFEQEFSTRKFEDHAYFFSYSL